MTWPELERDRLRYGDEDDGDCASTAAGANIVAVKGAPEAVLAVSTTIGKAKAADLAVRIATNGYDVQRRSPRRACVCLRSPRRQSPSRPLPSYDGLNFLGLVGFRDPPRVDVKQAIADCRQAGIRVVMVTGDHAVTARTIAETLGIAERGHCILVEGRELEALGALGEQERRARAGGSGVRPRDAGTEARARAASTKAPARWWP